MSLVVLSKEEVQRRLTLPVQEMPAQDGRTRCNNMKEVALGYSPEQAMKEAERCIQCKNAPCVKNCPVGINIPAFLAAAAVGNFDQSLATIMNDNLLPAVCGRVCPQEKQCQSACTVGKFHKDVAKAVSIGRVERFVADCKRPQNSRSPEAGQECKRLGLGSAAKKVGIVGSGPAGITAAADLVRAGFAVTIFEAFHKPGGVLLYGIPEFRLPKAIVAEEVAKLQGMGVEFRCNFLVGRTRTVSQLRQEDGYEALFIGSGAGAPSFMQIPGEDLIGVFSANEYLTRSNLMRAYESQRAATPILEAQRIAVIGGGNVAMDAARTALRIGAREVFLVYRRSEEEMPARSEESQHAKEEGVLFELLSSPVAILGDERGRVRAVRLQRYELGEPDASGRRRPIPIEGAIEQLDVDGVIMSIGSQSNPLIRETAPELKFNERRLIEVDKHLQTSVPGIFAGGDIVTGAATVIQAMGHGRRAAKGIIEFLSKN